ncbi:MAG: HipA N-terminal domain-containing protein [Planctomycetaceae bacterium]
MRTRRAIVRLDGQPVGTLIEAGRRVTFTYDPQWLARADAIPASVTLPLRAEPYVTEGLHPFFENLLPEGWLLELATRKLKISKDDAFGLLLATCADCVGAVEIVPAEDVDDGGRDE